MATGPMLVVPTPDVYKANLLPLMSTAPFALGPVFWCKYQMRPSAPAQMPPGDAVIGPPSLMGNSVKVTSGPLTAMTGALGTAPPSLDVDPPEPVVFAAPPLPLPEAPPPPSEVPPPSPPTEAPPPLPVVPPLLPVLSLPPGVDAQAIAEDAAASAATCRRRRARLTPAFPLCRSTLVPRPGRTSAPCRHKRCKA